ncbi:stage V sporulation protein B [Mammaliicoccus stepanovicii]|nr:polysaccharide biosynthesis protein [Mammaliicoccus stepanovicii]GGI43298.1 stage V sporulation protein B [Mammaliicoccus stepanovicii]
MMTQSKSTFNSVLLLSGTMVIVKILSAIYRVPYQNVLGDEGLYAYQQVYPLVAIVSVVSLNALPSVMSSWMINRNQDTIAALFWWLQSICLSVSIILFLCSHTISELMGDAQLAPMMRMASIALIPLVFISMTRGYYQMKHQMNTIAVSQVIDQVLRVVVILIAIFLYVIMNISIYQAGTIAISGSIIGLSCVVIYFLTKSKPQWTLTFEISVKDVKNVMTMTFLYAISYLILILWQVVDSFTLIHLLQDTGYNFQESIKVKGIFDRGASLIQMGLIVTTTFSFVLIPLLTEQLQKKNLKLANEYANTSLKITVLFSMAASIGLINLLPILNTVFFKTNELVGTLSIFMLSVIFVTFIIMYTALLQVKAKRKILFLALVVGLALKLLCNYIFVIKFGILGASISTVFSLSIYTLVLHLAVIKQYDFRNMGKFIFKIVITLAVMSLFVQLVLLIPANSRVTSLIVLVFAGIIGVIVVVTGIIKLKILKNEEMKHLPLMDKIIKE